VVDEGEQESREGPSRARVAWWFFVGRVLVSIVGRLPRRGALWAAWQISRKVKLITADRCRENMARLLVPRGWSDEQLTELFESHQRYMVRLRAEAARILVGPVSEIAETVELVGAEFLDEALADGRGAIVASAHEGTWWHVPTVLASTGRSVRSVFNQPPLASIERFLIRCATRHGMGLSIIEKGAREAFSRAVEDGALMYLTLDLAVHVHEKHWLPFGAAQLNVDPGPFILARRLKMPIVPARCRQRPDGTSEVVLGKPIRLHAPGAPRLREFALRFAEQLHEQVLKTPEQWWCWGFAELRDGEQETTTGSSSAA